MVEVKNKGFVIYKMNEFEKEIGILPLSNEALKVRKDNKGNLLILESGSIDSKGSISIFKVKRVWSLPMMKIVIFLNIKVNMFI